MMTLADDAATGSADREAVAIALGWRWASVWLMGEGFVNRWVSPVDGGYQLWVPDYQRDLAATLAEIERRGWVYSCGSKAGHYCAISTANFLGDDYEATGTTIVNAACAALLKSLENSDD